MKPTLILSAVLALSSCSEILQTPTLGQVTEGPAAGRQEEFEVMVRPLTLELARARQSDPYPRNIVKTGTRARVVPAGAVTRAILPPDSGPGVYRLGIGDQLTFAQFTDGSVGSINELINSDTTQRKNDGGVTATLQADQVISSSGRVGPDGSVLLLGLGKLNLAGKTLSEARDIARNVLIRTGIAPKFQLEITEFNSKKVYLVSNFADSKVVPLTDQGLTLRELVTAQGLKLRELMSGAGAGVDGSALVVIRIQRNGGEYSLTWEQLLAPRGRDIYLRDKDQVIVEAMDYKPGKVFVIGALDPLTVPIAPETRDTLADVLFTESGILASSRAQRSEVYLLRGAGPVEAFKLDITDPTRLAVAAEMQLRPNDIIFVPEQPLSSLNRALIQITPLRLLLRNIQAGNIP